MGPGRLASFAVSLADKLNLTPWEVRWRLYLPEALQYSHVLLFGAGVWTVDPFPDVKGEMAALRRDLETPRGGDPLLGL